MSPVRIRDALAAGSRVLNDREIALLWHAFPRPVRRCLADALHADLDQLAADEEALGEFGGRA
jgi:hypothetical protein